MANRYAVKSATLTFGEATFEMASGPAGKSETKDAVEVTALTDSVKQFIPGALKETDEFTVTLYDKGSNMPTVDDSPAALTIAVVLENGATTDVNASVSYNKVIVTKVAHSNVDASSDRKATVDVTFKPDGSVTASNSSGNS